MLGIDLKEFTKLEEKVLSEVKKGNTLSFDLCESVLSLIRERNARKPVLVVHCGETIRVFYKPRAGNQYWIICEQLMKGALDMNNVALANTCFLELEKQFGETPKIENLRGLLLETQDLPEARDHYMQIIQNDPTEKFAYRRLIALHKVAGSIDDAIFETNKYLKVFVGDVEAHLELSDLYLEKMEYEKALFCIEEAILINPHNYYYHLKCADVLYTLERFELSRKYYAQSLNLNKENNLRALYGLFMVCSIERHNKSQTKKKSTNISEELLSYSKEAILEKYKKCDTKFVSSIIQPFLEQ